MVSGILVLIATLQPVIIRNSVASIAMSTIRRTWTMNIKMNKAIPGPALPVTVVTQKAKAENDRKQHF